MDGNRKEGKKGGRREGWMCKGVKIPIDMGTERTSQRKRQVLVPLPETQK